MSLDAAPCLDCGVLPEPNPMAVQWTEVDRKGSFVLCSRCLLIRKVDGRAPVEEAHA